MAAPTDVAGLTAWYKADAITGLVDGDPIASWLDSSGGGNAATQGTSGARPVYKTGIVNGKAVARFDGTDDSLASGAPAGGAAQTIFAVISPDATATYRTIRGAANSSGLQFRITDADRQNLVSQATADLGSSTGTVTEGSFQALTATFSDAANEVRFYKNGTADGTASTAQTLSAFTTTIGRNGTSNAEFLDGDLAELLAYDTVLSAGDRAIVHTYIQDKYGITVSDYTGGGAATLVVANAAHAHTAGSVALTQHQVLAAANAAHGHVAGAVALTQHQVLAAANALHGHAVGGVALTQHFVLAAENAAHGHTAGNVTLAPGGAAPDPEPVKALVGGVWLPVEVLVGGVWRTDAVSVT